MRIFCTLILLSLFLSPAYGRDLREAYQEAQSEHEAALAAQTEAEQRILADKSALEAAIKELATQKQSLLHDIETLNDTLENLSQEIRKLREKQSQTELDMQELVGTVRVTVRDLESILQQSPFTASFPNRTDSLKPVLEKGHFPGMDDLKTISALFLEEMEYTGEVNLQEGSFVERSGSITAGKILTLGGFTAAYKTEKETGFLKYSEDSGRFFALSALPGVSVRRNLDRYIEGKSDDVYIDLSGGAALRQITHRLTLLNQIAKGGPIVWPILGIALIAFLLVIERLIFLGKNYRNTNNAMNCIDEFLLENKWQECQAFLEQKGNGPVSKILLEGWHNRNLKRETLENVLQESILRELPRLERYLPTLNILGAIAPLLGLLGTVTGMISTFHVITLYGSSDPRMMSGGISEALITTELGLAVAIPIMFIHTFLSRRIDGIIGDMEEKAVTFVNLLDKRKSEC